MNKPDETIFGRNAQKRWIEYAKQLEAELWVEKNNDFNYWRGWVDGFEAEENIAPTFFKVPEDEPEQTNEDSLKDEWGKFHPEKSRVLVIRNNLFLSDKYLYTTGVVKKVSEDMHSFAQGSIYSHMVEFHDLEPQYFTYGQLEAAE